MNDKFQKLLEALERLHAAYKDSGKRGMETSCADVAEKIAAVINAVKEVS